MILEFCSLFSGSSGNCIFASAGDTKLIIDAGGTCKRIEAALSLIGVSPKELDGILVTHEHTDHIAGAGVMSRKFGVPVYANDKTWDVMLPKLGAVDDKCRKVFTTGRIFGIKDIDIHPYLIPHDAAEPVGFCLMAGGKKAAVMTDLGYAEESALKAVEGSDVLLIEANHDVEMLAAGSYPARLKKRIRSELGHLSNDAAAAALIRLAGRNVKNAVLGHLSGSNNSEKLAFNTVAARLSAAGVQPEDMRLHMAFRDRLGGYFRI
ncbi:MAG: MBL fold metallo-hydrolase [Christensenellales bacterium]|jgi:phosphoribosyl 1,2-cyclic phosphodiesterase